MSSQTKQWTEKHKYHGHIFYGGVVGFVCGVFMTSLGLIGEHGLLVFLFLGFVTAFLWVVREERKGSTLFLLSIFLFLCALGGVRVLFFDIEHRSTPLILFEEREVEMEGVVVRDVDLRDTTQHLTLDVEKLEGADADGTVLLITNTFTTYRYGDRLSVRGVVDVPTSFETDLGRVFPYGEYLKSQGISHTFFFPETVEILRSGEGNVILHTLLTFKHHFMDRVEFLLPEPSAGLGEGLLLGVKRAIGEELEEVFRVVGIIHIVVLSGYNVTIVAEAIMRLLSFVAPPRVRVGFGIAAIASFALIAGLSATVLRASVMALLVLVARATGRVYDVLRALCIAGVVMLLMNPYLLVYDPGFQLSFLATMGLILLGPLIERYFMYVPSRLQIREFVVATIATQIFVLPLLLYSIGMFSSVSVFANVLVLPAVPFAMLFVFISGMVGFVSSALALPFAYIAHLLLAYIIGVAEILARIPFAAFSVPSFPFIYVVLAYILLTYVMYRMYRKVKNK